MKLPFVSREAYDEARAHWSDANTGSEDWRHAHARVLLMYEDLLAKYHTLKMLGANPAETFQPTPKPERDIVSDAIIVRSGNNVHLRRHYAEYVTFQRAAGIADVEIAAGILEGEVEEDGTP